jgi:predicted kinase
MVGKQLILMIGLPFSGKTTYVKNLVSRTPLQIIEGTSIALGLKAEGININNQNMQPVYQVQRIMAHAFMNRELPIIVDERNLTLESIFLWRQIAETKGYKVVGRIINTPVEICLERAKKQERGEQFYNHIKICSEQLDELKTMLAFKHQNILSNYEVINTEVNQ